MHAQEGKPHYLLEAMTALVILAAMDSGLSGQHVGMKPLQITPKTTWPGPTAWVRAGAIVLILGTVPLTEEHARLASGRCQGSPADIHYGEAPSNMRNPWHNADHIAEAATSFQHWRMPVPIVSSSTASAVAHRLG